MNPAIAIHIMMRQLVHFSDIHIGSGASRVEEYSKIFDEFCSRVALLNNPIIVLTGDVFHHKNKYSGDDVALFKRLLDGLAKYDVIVIPGNHDTSAHRGVEATELDLISPIVEDYKNVKYVRDSCVFTLGGISFAHVSVFDPAGADEIDARDYDDKVLLYHGMVNGAQFGSFKVSNERITVDRMRRTRATLLGDIHSYQIIEGTGGRAAYAGSLIQQNFGETTDKGYLVWELGTGKESPKITRHLIKGVNRFIKLDLRGKTQEEVVRLAREIKNDTTKESRISIVVEDDSQIRAASTVIGNIEKVSRVMGAAAPSATDPVADQLEILRDMLGKTQLDSSAVEEIINSHRERIKHYSVAKWHINKITWSNMFKYESGDIDFDKISAAPGISGVVAGNMSGKSSIFDIIVWGLYGKYLRGDKRSIIRFGTTLASTSIVFTSNDTMYKIERKELGKNKSTLTLYKKDDATGAFSINLTGKTMDATYNTVASLIGGHEQFLATGLYYDGINDIVKMTPAERRRVFPELFGTADTVALVRELKARIKVLRDQLGGLIKPRGDADPSEELKSLVGQEKIFEKQIQDMVPILHNAGIVASNCEAALTRYNNLTNQVASLRAVCENVEEAEPCSKPTSHITNQMRALAKETIIPSSQLEEALGQIPSHLRDCAHIVSEDDIEKHNMVIREAEAEIESLNRANAKLSEVSGKAITGAVDALRYSITCECCANNRELVNNGGIAREETARNNAKILLLTKKVTAAKLELAKLGTPLPEEDIKQVKRAAKLKAELERARAVERALETINAHVAWEKYSRYLRQRDAITEIRLIERQIAELGDIAAIRKALKKANASLSNKNILDELRAEHTKIMAQRMNLEREKKIWDAFQERGPALQKDLKKAEAYLECIVDDKLQLALARKHSNKIIEAVNDVLRGIGGFSLECDPHEGIFNGLTIVAGPTKLPVDMGSGFQKFIISIAFRIAFTTNLYSAPQFLCIDEGFGCMDETNTSKLGELFGAIRGNFRFVFIITHIAELQSIIQNPLYIKNNPTTISNSTVNEKPDHSSLMRELMLGNGGSSNNNNSASDTVTCECGAVVKARSLASHMKTKKHQTAMGFRAI